jgi:hypothetical protein
MEKSQTLDRLKGVHVELVEIASLAEFEGLYEESANIEVILDALVLMIDRVEKGGD